MVRVYQISGRYPQRWSAAASRVLLRVHNLLSLSGAGGGASRRVAHSDAPRRAFPEAGSDVRALPVARAVAGAVLLMLGPFGCNVLAQTAQGLDPGRLLREQQERTPELPREPVPPLKQVPAVEPPSVPDSTAFSVRVSGFQFSGVTRFATFELESVLADWVGKSATLQDLRNAAARIAEHYRARGYFLVQVVLPAQDVTTGIIRLQVIEGRLQPGDEGVSVQGARRLDPQVVRGILRGAIRDGVISQADLERGIFLLNDLPGASAQATIEPGTAPETSRIAVSVKEANLLRGSVGVDNTGSRYTGADRLLADAYLDNLSGSGDQWSASMFTAPGGHFRYGRLGYSVPLGQRGLIANLAYSSLGFVSDRGGGALRTEGAATSTTAGLRYPLLRGRSVNVSLSAAYEERRSTSETLGVLVNDRRLSVGQFGMTGSLLDGWAGGGITQIALGLSRGRADLDALPGAVAQDIAGPGVRGQYGKRTVSVTRIQSLSQSTVLQAGVNMMSGNKNLDGGEKVSITGPAAVRAYASGEATGDKTLIATLEARSVVARGVSLGGVNVGDLQLSAFYDYGHVQQYLSLWPGAALNGPNRFSLRGAGAGASLGKLGAYDMKLQYARKIGANPALNADGTDSDGSRSRYRLIFLATMFF